MDKEMVARLVGLIESGLKPAKPPPQLRLVTAEDTSFRGLDEITRDSHFRMIRHIRRRWGQPMQLLIDQACFGLAGIEQLDDQQLEALHRDLERAQDCMRDGVSFEDVGLIKSRYG
jgi:hypothetical protein